MQTKKRAKAVKFGKKVEKPASIEKEAPKAKPLIESKDEKHTPLEKIKSKPTHSQPEEQIMPKEEVPIIKEEIKIIIRAEEPEIKEEVEEIKEKAKETKIKDEETSIKEETFEVKEESIEIKEEANEINIKAQESEVKEETKIEKQPEIKEEDARITEVQQEQFKEIIINAPSQEPPQEPPKEPPVEYPEQSPEEPKEEKKEEVIKVEEEETYVVETKEKKNFLGYFMLIAIISFIIGLLSMAGINFYNQSIQESQDTKKTATTPKASPTTAPSPTPKPVDLSAYNIKVLNGSGITGAAAELQESLTSEGFTVSTTGNANTNNYTETTIYAGKNVDPEYLKKLKSFLKESYSLSSESSDPSESTADSEVIIIIGKN